MDEELAKYLVVSTLIFYELVPKVHDDHILIVLDELLCDFKQL